MPMTARQQDAYNRNAAKMAAKNAAKALDKAVETARKTAVDKGLGSTDIAEGRMMQTIAANTKETIGDTGLAEAQRQARLDAARAQLNAEKGMYAVGWTPQYPPSKGYMSDVERPSILGPGTMKRGSKPAGPTLMSAADDGMDALAGLMGTAGIGKGRRTKKKGTKKKGGKKKGGRKTRRRA